MTDRVRWVIGALTAVGAALWLMPIQVAGQVPAPTAKAWTAPRAPDGHPDLQGIYETATLTPVERPATAGAAVLSDEQAAAVERAEQTRVERGAQPDRADRAAPVVGGNVGGYNDIFFARGTQVAIVDGEPRASLVVDPPDGRIPALTPEAQQRDASLGGREARPDVVERAGAGGGEEPSRAFDDPEGRPLSERCLLGFGSTSGPPTLPNYFYNNLKQIVQTPGFVMILNEMIHDARIVRMGGEHLPPAVRRWNGDSVGRWEGETLVVDTTNFTDKTRFRGSSEGLHVVERLTRVDPDTIVYQFTVEDPATWARSWSGEVPWRATDERIYEYACHEGNYAMGGILRGARRLEQSATPE